MTEREKLKFIEYLRLKTRLKDASDSGTMLMFEGRYSDAETVAHTCVFNDTGYYMKELTGKENDAPDAMFIWLGDDSL